MIITMTHEEQNAIRDRAHDAIMAAVSSPACPEAKAPLLCRIGWHRWSVWSAEKNGTWRSFGDEPARPALFQKRACTKCGEVQHRRTAIC